MRGLLLLLLLGLPCAGADLLPANFANAAAYSRQHGGEALRLEQNGHLLFEDNSPGFPDRSWHKIYSGTKSYIAVTVVLLAQEGKLHLTDKASDVLTEWQHDARKAITLEQLLSQTAGLDPNGDPIYAQRDQLTAAVKMKLIDPPGKRFHYGAVNYQAIGLYLERKFHKSVVDVVTDTLLDPNDLEIANWKRDDAGNVMVHTGIAATTQQWAAFGNLLLTPKFRALAPMLYQGHAANPAYGLGFWLNNPQNPHRAQKLIDLLPAVDGDQLYPGGPRDLVAAVGYGRQRLYLFPSQQLVVVRFGRQVPFSDGDFLSRLLTGHAQPDAHTH